MNQVAPKVLKAFWPISTKESFFWMYSALNAHDGHDFGSSVYCANNTVLVGYRIGNWAGPVPEFIDPVSGNKPKTLVFSH